MHYKITQNTDIIYSPDDGGWYAQCFRCSWTGLVRRSVQAQQTATSDARTHDKIAHGE